MDKADDVQNIVVNYLNCDDTDIKITNICQDESFIYFTAENSGYNDIKGIFVNIYYIDSKTSNYIERTMLLPMEKWNYKVLKLDMISGLDISPMIGNINNKNVCSNRIYKFNDIVY
ncbi:MAG: hypothetical protein EOM23_07295, partial [Candidatus Moranbacteria bacterium]|nr:hypothetical protein [Candidatus Moranbacteria bacterium]